MHLFDVMERAPFDSSTTAVVFLGMLWIIKLVISPNRLSLHFLVVSLFVHPLGMHLWIGTHSWYMQLGAPHWLYVYVSLQREGTSDALWFRLMNIKDRLFSSWKKKLQLYSHYLIHIYIKIEFTYFYINVN